MKVITLHTSETVLIKKAAENNKEAQHRIFTQYASKMLSVCRYYITDLQFAEDVMITGFFKVFSRLRSFENKGSFEGWIRKIMVREAISFLRSKKQFVYLEDQAKTLSDDIQTPEDMTNLEVDEIQVFIDNLPQGYKTVFLMYAVEGYAHKEIAALLGISESTSKSQLHKARKMLQEKITQRNKKRNGTR